MKLKPTLSFLSDRGNCDNSRVTTFFLKEAKAVLLSLTQKVYCLSLFVFCLSCFCLAFLPQQRTNCDRKVLVKLSEIWLVVCLKTRLFDWV